MPFDYLFVIEVANGSTKSMITTLSMYDPPSLDVHPESTGINQKLFPYISQDEMILNKPMFLDNPSENSGEKKVNKSDILILNNRHSKYHLSSTRQEMRDYFERSHIL